MKFRLRAMSYWESEKGGKFGSYRPLCRSDFERLHKILKSTLKPLLLYELDYIKTCALPYSATISRTNSDFKLFEETPDHCVTFFEILFCCLEAAAAWTKERRETLRITALQKFGVCATAINLVRKGRAVPAEGWSAARLWAVYCTLVKISICLSISVSVCPSNERINPDVSLFCVSVSLPGCEQRCLSVV